MRALFILSLILLSSCAFDPPTTPANTKGPDQSGPTDMPGDVATDAGQQADIPADMPTKDMPTDTSKDVSEDMPGDVSPDTSEEDMLADVTPDVVEDMPPTLTMCDGEEVDLMSDPRHCGQCGVDCDAKFGECNQGTCGCTEPGYEACGITRRCEDTTKDPANCGQCGFGCGPGAKCEGSQCVCRPELTLCNGECVNTKMHPDHCGQCGNSCQGNACREGACRDNDQCQFGEGRCTQGSGVACLPRFGEKNDLYCRANLEFGCGDQCSGSSLCIDPPQITKGRGCYEFRLGRGCDSCPCDDCTEDEQCENEFGTVLCYAP